MAHLPLVSPVDRLLFLKAQPYLSRQPTEILTTLAAYTEEAYYAAGSEIRAPDAPVDRILFLAEGQVEVDMPVREGTARGADRIDAPGVVGLLHHFAGFGRGPGVRAFSDTVCIELEVDDLDQIVEDHFSLLLQFSERGAEEVRKEQARRRRAGGRVCEAGSPEIEMTSQRPSSLDLVERLALVRRMPFFAGTNLTVLGELVRFQEPRTFEVGDTLWSLGQRVEELALVLDGAFRLANSTPAVMAPGGSTIGAWEILSRDPRSEEWIATEASRVLMVPRELFVDLLEDHHDFALAYLRRSAELTLESR